MQTLVSGALRVCGFAGCDRKHSAKGYCIAHYNQMWRGLELKPIQSRRPNGEGTLKAGYAVQSINGRRTGVHRHVMEQYLGRRLLEHETVHHINGDRLDNRIQNLELWSTSQPPGQRVADKVAWALELLAIYSPNSIAR